MSSAGAPSDGFGVVDAVVGTLALFPNDLPEQLEQLEVDPRVLLGFAIDTASPGAG